MKSHRHNRLLGVVVTGVVAAGFALATFSARAQEPPAPLPYGFAAPGAGTALTTAINYQGRLALNGAPVNAPCDFIFSLHDALNGGAQIGGNVNATLQVQQGLFSAGLDFGAGAFRGQGRWLNTQVRCPTNTGNFTALTPRQPLLPAPYALALAAFTTQGGPEAPSVIGNPLSNTVSLTASGGFIGGGAQNAVLADYATVSGGELNTASSRYAVAGGYGNTAGGNSATVAGGGSNHALDTFATVGGGHQNMASNFGATVGGGTQNNASGQDALVSGGHGNEASSDGATAGGGSLNKASGPYATVGGGQYNYGGGMHATVSGGYSNTVTGWYATVSGGRANTANGGYAMVGGGIGNTASSPYATVSGGYGNAASGWHAAIGGGISNTASSWYATVGGGYSNAAAASSAAVSGGYSNTASGTYATVSGGYSNTASTSYATVSGGTNNSARGDVGATVAGGANNTASNLAATVGGGMDNVAGAPYATVGGGRVNSANDWFATVPGGLGAVARDYGQLAYASGSFQGLNAGKAQYSVHVLRNTTALDGAWVELYTNGWNLSPTRISVPAHTAQTFHILVTGLTSDYYVGSWEFRGVIKNTGGALTQGCGAATCIPTLPLKTVLQSLPTGEDVTVEADSVNSALAVKVKGNVYTTMRWVATVQVSEVGWD